MTTAPSWITRKPSVKVSESISARLSRRPPSSNAKLPEVSLRARKLPNGPFAACDRRGAAQRGHVPEAPAVVRRVEPVGGGDAERAAFGLDHAPSLRSTRFSGGGSRLPSPASVFPRRAARCALPHRRRRTRPAPGCGQPHPGRDSIPERFRTQSSGGRDPSPVKLFLSVRTARINQPKGTRNDRYDHHPYPPPPLRSRHRARSARPRHEPLALALERSLVGRGGNPLQPALR